MLRHARFLVLSSLLLIPSASAQQPAGEEELPEVVVVATREPLDVLRVPGNVTLIKAPEIKRSAASNLTEVLRTAAGLHVANTTGSTPVGAFIEARGFNNGGGNGGRTLVLVDDRRVNQADTSNPDWAMIPLESIERIEIIRGPATAIWGDSAMASVIKIVTKKGEGPPTIDVNMDIGSWDRFGQTASVQGSMEDFSYYISGGHSEEDGYRDNSEFRHSNGSARFVYRVMPEVELSLKGAYFTDHRGGPGSITPAEIEQLGRRGTVTPNDFVEDDQWNVDFEVVYTPTDEDKLSALIYYNQDEADFIYSYADPGGGTITTNDEWDGLGLGLRYTTDRAIREWDNKFTVGLDFIDDEITSDTSNNFPDPVWAFINRQVSDYQRELLGVYIHDEFSLTDRVFLGAGIRYDSGNFDYARTTTDLVSNSVTATEGGKDFKRWTPMASVTVLATDSISSYFTYARSYRFPNRDEMTGFFGLTPEIEPEKGENFEIGLKGRFGDRYKGQLSLYHLTVRDEILFRPPEFGAFTFGQNENFDEILHRGLELSASAKLMSRTTLFANYTYVDTEIERGPFQGGELPITPRHTGNIGASLDVGGGLSLWTNMRLVGNRVRANDLSNVAAKMPGFAVWDAKASYQYQRGAWQLRASLGLQNILDKEYEEFGAIGGRPHGSRVASYPSPELSFSAGLGISCSF